MRFGAGGPRGTVAPDDLTWIDGDDDLWEVTRGRREVRRCHDPLVSRILELRRRSRTDARRELDKLKYAPEGQRLARLRKKRDRGGVLTTAEWSRVAAYEDQLAALYTKLDRGKTST